MTTKESDEQRIWQELESVIELHQKEDKLNIEKVKEEIRKAEKPDFVFAKIIEILEPYNFEDLKRVTRLLENCWNVTPRDELLGWSPQEALLAREEASHPPCQIREIKGNYFLKDFEMFLDYLREKGVLELTKKGKLKRKDLLEISERIEDPRFQESHKMFLKITKAKGFGEENIPYIQRLRYVGEFLRLVKKKKRKIQMAERNFKAFFSFSLVKRFDLLWHSFMVLNWAYFHPFGEPNFAELIQKDRLKLWTLLNFYLERHQRAWIPFGRFAKDILDWFEIKAAPQRESLVPGEFDVEHVLIKDLLRTFSLVEFVKDGQKSQFRFTCLGLKVIPRQLKIEKLYLIQKKL